MPLFFLFDLSLEARAEISEISSLVFWEKRLFHKDILKLSDLYLGEISMNSNQICGDFKGKLPLNF